MAFEYSINIDIGHLKYPILSHFKIRQEIYFLISLDLIYDKRIKLLSFKLTAQGF